jgi:hypothetical protein
MIIASLFREKLLQFSVPFQRSITTANMIFRLRSLQKKKELRQLKRIFLARPPRQEASKHAAKVGVSKVVQKNLVEPPFPPPPPSEETIFGKLKESLGKPNFKEFLIIFQKTVPVSEDQKEELISILSEWNRQKRPSQESSIVLSVLPIIHFSSTSNNAQEKLIIDAIIRGYLKKRNRKAASSIAQFFIALKNLNYFWKDLSESQKKKTVHLLENIDQKELIAFSDYDEILMGMVHLDMRWDDLTTAGKECLLLSFSTMTNEKKQLTGIDCRRIITKLNYLQIKFDIDEVQVVKQGLMEMLKEGSSPREKIVSRLNNLLIKFEIDRGEQALVKQGFIEIFKKALNDHFLDNKEVEEDLS